MDAVVTISTVKFVTEQLLFHKWENAFNMDIMSWGFRRKMAPEEIMDFQELLETVVVTISCGGKCKNIPYLCYNKACYCTSKELLSH